MYIYIYIYIVYIYTYIHTPYTYIYIYAHTYMRYGQNQRRLCYIVRRGPVVLRKCTKSCKAIGLQNDNV